MNGKLGEKVYELTQICAPFVVIIGIIWWGIQLKDGTSCKSWEEASVIWTLIYTVALYCTGFFGDKFKSLKMLHAGLIALVLFIIFLLTCSAAKEELVILGKTLSRIEMMQLYFSISVFYLLINMILIKGKVPEKEEIKTTVLYCDVPICFAFLILWLYAYYLGVNKIKSLNLDPFFSGAIAFQMILSNVVWGFIDNNKYTKKIFRS